MKPILILSFIVTLVTISSGLFAQERIISRDATEYDLGNDRKQIVIQKGQNYLRNGAWRKYDSNIRAEASGGFTHVFENEHTVRFKTTAPQMVRIERDGHYVQYSPIGMSNRTASISVNSFSLSNAWNETSLEVIPTPEGVKENIILSSAAAPASYTFHIESDITPTLNANGIIVFADQSGEHFFMPKPFAYDARNLPVSASYSLRDSNNSQYLDVFIIDSDTTKVEYPLTIDPSIYTTQPGSWGKDAPINQRGPNFNNGDTWYSYTEYWTDNKAWRVLYQFDSLGVNEHAVIQSCTLRVRLHSMDNTYGNSATVSVFPLTMEWNENECKWDTARTTPSVATWSGGKYSPDTSYSKTITYTGPETNTYYNFIVTDIAKAWISGTRQNYGLILKLANDTTGSTYRSLLWYTSDEAYYIDYRPKLIIQYSGLASPDAPSFNLPSSFDSTSQLYLSLNDSKNDSVKVDYAMKFVEGDLTDRFVDTDGSILPPGDTTWASELQWQNIFLDEFKPNEKVVLRTFASWRDSGWVDSSAIGYRYTRANAPKISVGNPTDSSLSVLIEPEIGDTSLTCPYYAILENTSQRWIKIVDSVRYWAINDTAWYNKQYINLYNPIKVKQLAKDTLYIFSVIAQNGDGIRTPMSNYDSMYAAIPPAHPENLVLFPSNKMTLMWSRNTEPDLWGYKVYRSAEFPPTDSIAFVLKSDSTYTDSSASLGTDYYYWITAVDSFNAESGASDYVTGYPGYVLSIPDVYGFEHDTLMIPIVTSDSMTLDEIYSFQFHIGYDETVVQFTGFDTAGTLSSSFYTVQVHDSLGVVNIAAFDTVPIPGGNDTIIFLNFVIDVDTGSNAGHSDLIFAAALVDDDNNYVYTTDGRISVKGLVYGDPSLNDSVTIYDCSLVLQHNIARKFLNGLQQLVADVSGNGLVTVYDASLILKYTIGMIDTFPAGDTLLTKTADPPSANAALNLVYSTDTQNKLITVDIAVSGAGSNVSAISLDLGYPSADLEYERYTLTALTENFMAGVEVKNGVVKIGLANGHALAADGKLIRLYFRMKESTTISPQFRLLAAMLNETSLDMVTSIAQEVELPKTYELSQNYPNPFNPETEIAFSLPDARFVKLVIYNILGQEVKILMNDYRDAGSYQIKWDGTNNAGSKVASGIYIYRFRAENGNKNASFEKVRKMVFLK